MPARRIEIHPARNVQDVQEANDLMAKVFRHDYYETIEWMRTTGARYPGFRPEHTRLARVEGELAGALRVTSDTIRIGEARLHMGGFGWIATAGNHRHKGVARALIADTLRFMQEHSYHVSMLFGIPNFYHRFGFHTTLAEYTTRVDVRDIPEYAGPPFRVRTAKPGDVRIMQRMHEQADSGTACSIVRCAAHFNYHWQRWQKARIVMAQDGKVLGYFLASGDMGSTRQRGSGAVLFVEEAGVVARTSCGVVLEAAARQARESLLSEVQFHGPPTHPLIEYLCQFRSRHLMELTSGEGGMLCVVNPVETLESMIPEWEYRLQQMGERELNAELTLYVDRMPYAIRCHHGALSVAQQPGTNKLSLSGEEFVQLLTGYRYLPEILATHRRIINGPGMALAQAMFPKRDPYVWRADRF